MILEGIVTTLNADGMVNIAPMGPRVDQTMSRLLVKPFRTSTTYQNLKRTGQGVFHVTDDVELLARAAIGPVEPPPALGPACAVDGQILLDACRWYAFRAESFDERGERVEIDCRVIDRGSLREFFGLNRAKHAVVEAAILATRVAWLPREEIVTQFDRLRVLVDKTGGEAEHRAFRVLTDFVQSHLAVRPG